MRAWRMGTSSGTRVSGLLSQELERFERPLAGMPLGQLFPR